jgi:uncharacterized protein
MTYTRKLLDEAKKHIEAWDGISPLKGERMETELMCPECGVIVPDPSPEELCPEGCGKGLVLVPDSPTRSEQSTVPKKKSGRGFGSMSPERQREIASKGGRAAHMKGTGHEWTREEARAAGRKGGQVSRGGRGRLAPPEGNVPNEVNRGGMRNPSGDSE